jgi:branched-chain amino acid transport system ATP-binding protein
MMVENVFEVLTSLNRAGTTILLVEQNIVKTLEVADRVYVLRPGGRVAFTGEAKEVAGKPEFEQEYLGLDSMQDSALA